MVDTRNPRTCEFQIGEEVVVRLEATRVFQVEGDALQLWAMPLWTIAEVLDVRQTGSGNWYDVRFRHRGGSYRCEIREAAIEGRA